MTRWGAEDLAAFAAGGVLYARDADAQTVPLPRPVAERGEAGEVGPDWATQVALLHPADRGATIRLWLRCRAEPGVVHETTARSQADGTWRAVHIRMVDLLAQPDVGAVLVCVSVGERIEPPQDAPEADSRFRAPPWTLQLLDPQGVIVRTDGMVEHIFGLQADELTGRPVIELLHPDDHDAALAMWLELLAAPRSARTIRQRVRRPDGGVVWIESTVMNRIDDEFGAVVSLSQDITDLLAAEAALHADREEARRHAETDPLTGLANRRAVDRALEAALATEPAGTVVLFADLDGFKDVNDNLGHEVGDAVLCEVADRLRAVTRPGDLLARFGGDEFVLVLPRCEPGTEADLAGRMAGSLAEPLLLPTGARSIAMSVGWARGATGDRPRDLLRRADDAMYTHKRAGA